MSSSSIKIADGLRVAYQEWGKHNRQKILALHGWLDNSNSFIPFAEHLSKKFHIVAFDHLGHGHSSHLPQGANYTFAKHVSTTKQVFEGLGWDKCHVVGHSMGAGVATVYAAAYPESVHTTSLIEGFGPITRPVESTVEHMRKAIDAEITFSKKAPMKKIREYGSFEEAVEARVNVVNTYDGDQSLSREAAALLVARGAFRTDDADRTEDCCSQDKPLAFRYDSRLLLPSHVYLTNDQAAPFVEALGRTLLITGEKGWPFPESYYKERKEAIIQKGLFEHIHFAGEHASHHLHMDPACAKEVAACIEDFLDRNDDRGDDGS